MRTLSGSDLDDCPDDWAVVSGALATNGLALSMHLRLSEQTGVGSSKQLRRTAWQCSLHLRLSETEIRMGFRSS